MTITWLAGARDQGTTDAFTQDTRGRLYLMPQVTSSNLDAIGKTVGPDVDYGQELHIFASDPLPLVAESFEGTHDRGA